MYQFYSPQFPKYSSILIRTLENFYKNVSQVNSVFNFIKELIKISHNVLSTKVRKGIKPRFGAKSSLGCY